MRRLLASFRANEATTPLKTLVFSRSTKMLDAAQSVLEFDGHRCVRIDGIVVLLFCYCFSSSCFFVLICFNFFLFL